MLRVCSFVCTVRNGFEQSARSAIGGEFIPEVGGGAGVRLRKG